MYFRLQQKSFTSTTRLMKTRRPDFGLGKIY
jgi:hypothetical protein